YASIVELIKYNTGYITRYMSISHIYSKVPICYTIKGTCKEGKRLLNISRLRPNILLYGKPYLDNKKILETTKYDLRIYPELVLIISIKLVIPSARLIAADFYYTTRSIGKASFWISKKELIWSIKSLYNYILIRNYNKVISLDILKLSN
ncbi:uncharacterized protein K444DRAFT_517460, partial [Hyaloscypha bicolor E]